MIGTTVSAISERDVDVQLDVKVRCGAAVLDDGELLSGEFSHPSTGTGPRDLTR